MPWTVLFSEEFEPEFDDFPQAVQDAILAQVLLLERERPSLGRPHADTLTGSKHVNMKELRCNAAGGVWRIAFAFDPGRQAIDSACRRGQVRWQRKALL
ncbi:type II toxin-antitoxin system RelE/ParE family toxin [Rhodovulum visakhapatnamense]|uniref:type II toxin-antitoxin system RelE/ParE family toxin n=1 Tax=Rhodovulum visakhapatnamense TaxID=364297 RepID=UPI001FB8E770|nr:type II toxin-antitoxin system RelE/ParE family toxin [Rhodovulum visakhapatnamense]